MFGLYNRPLTQLQSALPASVTEASTEETQEVESSGMWQAAGPISSSSLLQNWGPTGTEPPTADGESQELAEGSWVKPGHLRMRLTEEVRWGPAGWGGGWPMTAAHAAHRGGAMRSGWLEGQMAPP